MHYCPFCEEPVDPNEEGVYWHVSGWAPFRPSGGGFNSISLRSDPTGFAHPLCIRRETKKAVLPQTETLF